MTKCMIKVFYSFIKYFHETVDSTYQFLCIEFIDIIYTYYILGVYRISGRPDNPAPNLRFAVYPDPAGS